MFVYHGLNYTLSRSSRKMKTTKNVCLRASSVVLENMKNIREELFVFNTFMGKRRAHNSRTNTRTGCEALDGDARRRAEEKLRSGKNCMKSYVWRVFIKSISIVNIVVVALQPLWVCVSTTSVSLHLMLAIHLLLLCHFSSIWFLRYFFFFSFSSSLSLCESVGSAYMYCLKTVMVSSSVDANDRNDD